MSSTSGLAEGSLRSPTAYRNPGPPRALALLNSVLFTLADFFSVSRRHLGRPTYDIDLTVLQKLHTSCTSLPSLLKGGKLMRIRAPYLAVALAVTFAANAHATIVGSTYDFTTSVTGSTQIAPLGGPTSHTDPANPGFCVGPPVACDFGAGVSGSFAFTQTPSPTDDTITFTFFGSTEGAGPGTFAIDLGNFQTVDGEVMCVLRFGKSAGGRLYQRDL
jgi:hypothetical protein